MEKSTVKETELLDEIEIRKSLRAYSDKALTPDTIKKLFEAARWAPSSNNEQPWVYIYATKDQPLWQILLSSLVEANRVWAQHAPLLVLALVRKNYVRNGRPNASAKYDLGAANAFLTIQATELGLNVHQMGGFEAAKAIETLSVPDTHEPVVMLAIGYAGDAESLPENLKQRETALRERYTQETFVMNKAFD